MILNAIYEHAKSRGHHRAVVWNGYSVRYLDLALAIENQRRSLAAHRLPKGSVVVVVIHSLLDSWIVVLALQSMGLTTLCVRSPSEATRWGLSHISAMVLCSRKSPQNPQLSEQWPGIAIIRIQADLFGQPVDVQSNSLTTTATKGGGHLLYTSGTTGSPKLLFHACDQEGERLAHRAHLDQIDESTVSNTVHLGLWTAIGYRRPLMVWLKGGCVVFDQSEDWAVNLGKFNETHVSFMSGMLDTVIRATSDAQAPPYRFKLSIGGGFVSMQQAQSVLKQLTPNFSISYASTELCSPALKLQIRQDSDIQWLEPVPGRESEIVDAHGRTCSPLEEGILRIRLNALDHDAYVADEEATQKVFRDGWFYPGDLAVRRPDGRIRILGRVNDVINVNGNKYASAPIESKIQSILSVRAACVFNGTDSKGVNHLMVVVENDTPVTTAQIKEVKEQLPLLDRASFFQTDKLPVNSTGTQKVDRRRLREHILREKFK